MLSKALFLSISRHNRNRILFSHSKLDSLSPSPQLNIPHNALHHLAIIVDGNGRWAEARNMSRLAGHKAGANKTMEMIKICFQEENIKVLTLFLFSTENWRRPMDEIQNIMVRLVAI